MGSVQLEHPHVETWWKELVLAQLYPASYKSTTGGSTGDLPGILEKLDYLQKLGVTGIWISPCYASPQVDLGYDISDYQAIAPEYGHISDLDAIIEGCHSRGMKCLLDLVINHTSDQHRWFIESRSSKDNAKHDWYYWKDATYDSQGNRVPPNNWRSCFGGSVWQWDETRQQYYLHYFCPEQPDLNWENPAVREALYEEAVKFWLRRGIDGFRVDTVNMYSKHLDFPNAPVVDHSTPWQPAGMYFCNGPRLHEFLREMRAKAFEEFGAITIGELPNTPDLDDTLSYVSADAKALDMAIKFDLADLDHPGRFALSPKSWTLAQFKEITGRGQQLIDPARRGWAVTFIENHDQARCVSRYASDAPEHRVSSAKMLAIYQLSLSGTEIIYQGQELGFINAPKSWPIEEYTDCNTVGYWKDVMHAYEQEKDDAFLAESIRGYQLTARDHARTPMHWDDSRNAGFTTGDKTWMRVMDSYKEINAAQQENDPDSVLNFYRKLIQLRKSHKQVFVYGKYDLVDGDNLKTFTFTKTSPDGKEVAFVALNFSSEMQPLVLGDPLKWVTQDKLVAGCSGSAKVDILEPWEGRLYLRNQ